MIKKVTIADLLYSIDHDTPLISEYFDMEMEGLPEDIKGNFLEFTDNDFFRLGQITALLISVLKDNPDIKFKQGKITLGEMVSGIKEDFISTHPSLRKKEKNLVKEAKKLFDLGFGIGMVLRETENITANFLLQFIPPNIKKGEGGKPLLN